MLQLEQQSTSSLYSQIWQLMLAVGGASPGTVDQNTCTWSPDSIVALDFSHSNSELQQQCSREPATSFIAFYDLDLEVVQQRSHSITSTLQVNQSLLLVQIQGEGHRSTSQNLQMCFKTTMLIQEIVSSLLCPSTVLCTSQ